MELLSNLMLKYRTLFVRFYFFRQGFVSLKQFIRPTFFFLSPRSGCCVHDPLLFLPEFLSRNICSYYEKFLKCFRPNREKKKKRFWKGTCYSPYPHRSIHLSEILMLRNRLVRELFSTT